MARDAQNNIARLADQSLDFTGMGQAAELLIAVEVIIAVLCKFVIG